MQGTGPSLCLESSMGKHLQLLLCLVTLRTCNEKLLVEMQKYVCLGADVDSVDNNGKTALRLAAFGGYMQPVQRVSCTSSNQSTPTFLSWHFLEMLLIFYALWFADIRFTLRKKFMLILMWLQKTGSNDWKDFSFPEHFSGKTAVPHRHIFCPPVCWRWYNIILTHSTAKLPPCPDFEKKIIFI